MKEYIGTIDSARFCNITRPTMRKWVDMERVKAYVTPGGTARIAPKDLVETLKKLKMPVPDEFLEMCGTRVLIVDDEQEMVNILRDAIGNTKGFICDSSYNGYDACFKLGPFKPHIILLDLMMPFMDGYEFLKEMKRNALTKDTQVIVITGQPDSELAQRVKNVGVDKVMEKPFDIEEVLWLIKSIFKTNNDNRCKEKVC